MAQITEIVENNKSANESIDESNNSDINQVGRNQRTKFQLEYEEAYTLEEAKKML